MFLKMNYKVKGSLGRDLQIYYRQMTSVFNVGVGACTFPTRYAVETSSLHEDNS